MSQKTRNTTQQNIQQYHHLIRTQNITGTQVVETDNTRQNTTGTNQKSELYPHVVDTTRNKNIYKNKNTTGKKKTRQDPYAVKGDPAIQ